MASMSWSCWRTQVFERHDGGLMGAVIGLLLGSGLVLVVLSLSGDRTPRGSRRSRLADLIARSGITRVTPPGVIGACAAAAVVTGVLALIMTAVPVIAVLAGIAAAVVPIALLRRRAVQRDRAVRACWPDAVDALVSAVRAGLSLPEALSDLARRGPEPLRPAFSAFAADLRASGSFATSLDRLQDRLADPVADRVITSLRIAREVGGTDLGIVLRTLSALLRDDARTRGEIEGRQSWTVSSARVAIAAPWVTLALLCTRPQAVEAYRTATGAVVVLASVALTAVAYRIMLRIARLPAEPRMLA